MVISKEFEFCAAHLLPFHRGKCKSLHGHSYRVEVQLVGDTDEFGMVEDFGDLKVLVNPILDELDHSFLVTPHTPMTLVIALKEMGSKVYGLPDYSTAENLVHLFLELIGEQILSDDALGNVRQLSVKVWESPTSWAQGSVEFADEDEGSTGSSLEGLIQTLEGMSDLISVEGLLEEMDTEVIEDGIPEEEKLDVVYSEGEPYVSVSD
jgi:6-pyruvoyltetrahydropterin/6-carboxytetrahydropterin synthase